MHEKVSGWFTNPEHHQSPAGRLAGEFVLCQAKKALDFDGPSGEHLQERFGKDGTAPMPACLVFSAETAFG